MVKPRAEAVSELSEVDSAPAAQTTAPFSLGGALLEQVRQLHYEQGRAIGSVEASDRY